MIIVNPKLIKILSDGFARAMAIFPFVILGKEEYRDNQSLINHERIHLRQQIELLIIPFYLWYFIEFLHRKGIAGDRRMAYRNISFEREAYDNQSDLDYLKNRKLFSFVKYIGHEDTR